MVHILPLYRKSCFVKPNRLDSVLNFQVIQILRQNYKTPWLSSLEPKIKGNATADLSVNRANC